MTRRRFFCLTFSLSAVLFLWTGLATAQATKTVKENDAIKPVPRANLAWWMARQKEKNERIKQGHVDLLYIGDSIIHGWEGRGKKVWNEYYGKRNAVNLGFGGDRTQHVIWRLEHGNIDGISPKLAILMIGTNNSGDNTPEQIAAGVKVIVQILRAKLPKTKVLILAIFPRGPNEQDHRRQVNEKANKIIAKLADGKMVLYEDIGAKFLEKDGTLSRTIMPDLLHPNAKGYEIWAKAVEPTVAKIMGPK